jgi:hypothetical protein
MGIMGLLKSNARTQQESQHLSKLNKKNQICQTGKRQFEVETDSCILLPSSRTAFNNKPIFMLFCNMETEGNDF